MISLMAILVLNRYPKSRADYEEWFKELDDELYMLGYEETINDFNNFSERKSFSNFLKNGEVDYEAINLFNKKPYRAIISLEEGEVLRAASLRDRLGIAGQSLESALAFRNKLIMKTIAEKNGIPVATFKKIDTPVDIFEFVKQYGFPIVVKPVLGWSSIDTKVFYSERELMNWMKLGEWEHKLVESYIGGEMYHVDGVAIDKQVKFACASSYVNTCLHYLEEKGKGSAMLELEHPFRERLVNFVKNILQKFPTPDITTFHAEIFHTVDDNLVMCEIASRTVGSKVQEIISQAFGIDLNKFVSRAQCGLMDELPSANDLYEPRGIYFVPPWKGILKEYPDSIPFDWCTGYIRTGIVGERYEGPIRSNDCYAICMVKGDSEKRVQERLSIASTYIQENSIWEI